MNRTKLFLWSSYDFANSIIFINFLLYFAGWLVIDGGLADIWYNSIFAVAAVLLVCSAPPLAARVDRRGGRRFWLNMSTVGAFTGYGLAVATAHLGQAYVAASAILFLFGHYFYQLSFVFYHAMIGEVSDPRHRSRASGVGQFANALGQIVGVALTLPLADSRLSPLAPALAASFLLALPMMIFFREDGPARPHETQALAPGIRRSPIPDPRLPSSPGISAGPPASPVLTSVRTADETAGDPVFSATAGRGSGFGRMRRFFALSAAAPMLVAFFLFNDAMATLGNNYSVAVERVFGVTDSTKSLLLMAILVMAALGGIMGGWAADRWGAYRVLEVILVLWIIVLPVLAVAPTFPLFTGLTIPVGMLIGSLPTVCRAYISNLLAKDEMTYGFSLYTIFDRFAALAGPLAWGGIVWAMAATPAAYRTAIAAMTIFIVAGLGVLIFSRRPRHGNIVHAAQPAAGDHARDR